MTPSARRALHAREKQILSEADLLRLHAGGRIDTFVQLAEWARRRGDLAEAMSLLERGLAAMPDRISGWVLQARLNMQMGRMDEAMLNYRHILSNLDGRNLPALRALAVACIERENPREALDLLKRWRVEDPLDPEAEDLLEDLQIDGGEQQPVAKASADAEGSSRSVLDLSLEEIERELMSAPSLEDREAWLASIDPAERGKHNR